MYGTRKCTRLLSAAALGAGALAVSGVAASTLLAEPAGAVTCATAGSTGLTAAVVAASNNQVIASQTVDATGCDIGIYVPPNITGVTIGGATTADAVTVSGANDTGIFVEQTSGVTIQNDTVQNNGVNPSPGVGSFGGIVLAGVANGTVSDNTVTNNGGGGVFVNDNGPVDPGAPNAGPNAPVPSTDDTVSGNSISGNYGSCGIVYATHNSGGSISGGVIENNTITGHIGVFRSTGPDLGGIVVAAASAGATVTNTQVTGNNISNSFEGGIIVHAHAPNDVVTGTSITGNTVGPANNWGSTNGPPTTAGIILGVDQLPPAIAPTITNTTVGGNTIFGQFYGLWISGVTDVTVNPANTITVTPGGAPTFNTPAPGSGYWQVAADGGVFSYGAASYFGSTGGIKLNKPVVGMAPTQDQGGYWLVASDGGVFSFGDAAFHGSTGNLKLNQPVVAMAPTPYVPGAGGAPASPAGLGYWLVASDGGIFNFGDAGFYGSTGNLTLNKPIVGMAPTPDGKGYWLVASDGGVFNYGDAGFFGSASTLKPSQPIVGMAATPDGKGYWLVSANGTVYNFGTAGQFGDASTLKLNKAVVGISATPDGKGYWLSGADGGVYNYGDATFFGSAGNLKLNQPVVGMASVGTTFSG
ncbi:MAG: right-handed parallel beta-helix repeat-containing protein [Acidimicrobiales bacterium]